MLKRKDITLRLPLAVFLVNVAFLFFSHPVGADDYNFQDGVYPTSSYNGTRDTFIKEETPSTNYGTQTTIEVDGDDPESTGRDSWGIIKWDLSTIPSGTTVLAAMITIYITNPGNAYNIYRMKRDWLETEATWNIYSTGNNWETPGAQGTNDRGSASLGSTPAAVTGRRYIMLNSSGIDLVQGWVDGTISNYGVIIGHLTRTNGLDFSSREGTTASQRPKLTVITAPCPYLQDVTQSSIKVMWKTDTLQLEPLSMV